MHQEGDYQPKITREIHHQSTIQIPDEGSCEISCTVDLSNTGSTSSMDTKKAISTSNSCRNNKPLRRARQQASTADGISWDMEEDAIEEGEQTYTGELSPKQEKTFEEILTLLDKESNKRSSHIERRIAKNIYDSFLKNLRPCIRESLDGKTWREPNGKKKGFVEDEEDFTSNVFGDGLLRRAVQNPYLKNTMVNKTNPMIEEDDSILEKVIG
ncbi:hypothetical protein F2Q69_00055058 [Brassica cretica]|uniref:Uncharacterized protein n=1 Tax=Brassica cretica TaxID=69181 RepID=A0A8S9N6P0_BRACR|nr:hypothetical protein F2Q69_00055058 [Brassica cretica]